MPSNLLINSPSKPWLPKYNQDFDSNHKTYKFLHKTSIKISKKLYRVRINQKIQRMNRKTKVQTDQENRVPQIRIGEALD